MDFTQARVDLRRDGTSAFMVPDLSTASKTADGSIAWNPGVAGVLGGLVIQSSSSDHGGERHLDSDELIAVVAGRLALHLLDDSGAVQDCISLTENQAPLVPRGVWHRLQIEGDCRYLFFGGGRTELRRG